MCQRRHVNSHAVLLAFAVFGFFTKRDPSLCSKVGGFSHVESLVETPMVAVRERNHELALLLHCVRDWNGLAHQYCRRNHGVFVAQKL